MRREIGSRGVLELAAVRRRGSRDGGAARYLTLETGFWDEYRTDGEPFPEIAPSWDGAIFIWYVLDR
ncbi:hypothetical protein [Nonomuraea sp. NPDC050310]|uniref:hypothetical protein n=1 Tax=Nonomuraea sp. NPDC050310 TaxID=3154935 RepID=UPI0033E273F2